MFLYDFEQPIPDAVPSLLLDVHFSDKVFHEIFKCGCVDPFSHKAIIEVRH